MNTAELTEFANYLLDRLGAFKFALQPNVRSQLVSECVRDFVNRPCLTVPIVPEVKFSELPTQKEPEQ
jgi:hypothetical protein